MKKILIVIFIVLLTSCRSKDKLISLIIDQTQNEVNNYNSIKRMTNDRNVIKFVDSLKKSINDDAHKSFGVLDYKDSYFEPLDSSIIKINILIDSLKN
jgi:hypothetical protein